MSGTFNPASVQPVVLVGGRSSRFGRDKLREPVGSPGCPSPDLLVDRPIRALREVFGPRVAAVGACDPLVLARFDLVLPDGYPGAGPAGGVLAALEAAAQDVFVLAGDLPAIDASVLHAILHAATMAPPGTWAVLADRGQLEPCVGLYRQDARPSLQALLESGRPALHRAIPVDRLTRVPIDPARLRNVNTPADLPTFTTGTGPTPLGP